jgi:hypothetical protein
LTLYSEETVRSIVPVGARFSITLLLLAFVVLNLPAFAANARPLGVVLTADHARLDNASATIGADVFSGDALVTDRGGSMRVTMGPSQVYLLSASAATLEPDANRVQTRVNIGTVGFSTSSPEQLEIQTPLGMIRGADNKPIFGQVSVLSAWKMRITSYEGTLAVTDHTGVEKLILAGETYDATLAGASADNPPPKGVTGAGINWAHVVYVAVPLVAAGVLACALWPESPSGLGCW